ncbi:MAG: leucine--tRNA ligase [Deltaproteobacteria bacterium]|jgi:leucyl-tRNA synthetase|nr:leucine--tRNA ligase [Deltaproteobacteria bacterium]
MVREYNFQEIEARWQKFWKENKIFESSNHSNHEPYYILVEFPYPSGAGLHVGHCRSYTALDALARLKRMQGYNVLFPIGWDAFGAPAEQYAIKHHIHPKNAVEENIKIFKSQIESLGISFDWEREFSTTDTSYYKWTQWQFLQFYKHALAYKAKRNINWCPICNIGLSNEDSSGGICERCGNKVVQKEKEQWMLKMADYAEDLLAGLADTKFSSRIKIGQINWIGKSFGAEIDFRLEDEAILRIYTTRPDTIYGATFLVLAPEHQLIDSYCSKISNLDEVLKYREAAKNKTEFERSEILNNKSGVELKGLKAINPVNNSKISIWVADYVLLHYGTGAIMAVPAHDERDYDFAKKYSIPIIEVIKGGDINRSAYTGGGEMINSNILNGCLNKEVGINKIIEFLESHKIGRRKVNYRLQDWIFSRQRFWGEPIPLIYCSECGWCPVPENELPVVLPDVAQYEPTETGESPLANISEWVEVSCPKCGKPAKRETDTMPNWAGSSWYWLRYMDPHNEHEFVGQEALNYWGKVNWYNGGMEHTARHLLYARFWNQFLYNIGLVPNKEPFEVRVSHGMVLGPDNEKMSKSRGNIINPDEIVKKYGADTLRTYEMFIGDYEKDVAWSTNGLIGCFRFLRRVWVLQEKIVNKTGWTNEVLVNQTIKKVISDIYQMKYNTAVSTLMILLNEYEKYSEVTKDELYVLLHLLNPIAPHITEEINLLQNLGEPLCNRKFPTFDENKLSAQSFEMVVQVNGKLRGRIQANINLSAEEMKQLAMTVESVKPYYTEKEIVRLIVVPNKLVNLIVR